MSLQEGQELRDPLARVRPEGMAPFSERLAWAALPEQLRSRDEAVACRMALAAEKPDSPSLQALAGG